MLSSLDIAAPHAPLADADPDAPEIAVVIPIYKSGEFIAELVARLHATLRPISERYQIVLVDDRSPDEAWSLILHEVQVDPRVMGVRLSRNFGQHAAISAGLAHARARWYVVMDGDLQDPPEAIADLHARAALAQRHIVIAARAVSGLGIGRSIGSAIFNTTLRWASGLDVSSEIGNFRIFSHRVAEAFRRYPEQLRLFPAIMSQVGFESERLVLPRHERPRGRSSYNFVKLARLAFETIVAFSERPLRYMAAAGFTVCILSALYGLFVIVRTVVFGTVVPGFATIAAMLAFLGGVQISIMSFVGLYVGRVLAETKRRPVFIVDEVSADAR